MDAGGAHTGRRTDRVLTNLSCNQMCGFCDRRRPREDPVFVARAAVESRISAALARGVDTLVLTGGEPTMRRDLCALVASARAKGAKRVELETNAALIDDALARGLAEAGLSAARVHVPAWGEALERINRDPGGFAAMLAGVTALARAGVDLEAATPVVSPNRESLAALPGQLAASGVPFAALVVSVPTTAPDDAALLPLESAARVIAHMEMAARQSGLPFRFQAGAAIPPCAFETPGRIAHLYSLTRGGAQQPGFTRLPGCADCSVVDRCPGIPEAALARQPSFTVRPIRSDRVRRRLSVISTVEAQVTRELYQDDIIRRPDGTAVPARIVRVNFRCNQACHFCFVSTHLPAASEELVEAAIVGVAKEGGVVVLSGGEPTLNPRILDYVALARASGASDIELQTNAVRLGQPGFAQALADAGVDQAFISLHGSRASISDAVTDSPGTFAKTVVGIDAWVKTGKSTRINFVFCGDNADDFVSYVELVAKRWPTAVIIVSFVAPSTDMVPRTRTLIPRYSEVLPALSRGMARAAALGICVGGFESMCGIPLCLVPSELAAHEALATIPEGFDGGEFVKSEACHACSLTTRCFGVRRGYADLYGTEEFRPVAR